MATDLESWARAEREFLRDEIKWYTAGAKLISPSGADITKDKQEQLERRLEHVLAVLKPLGVSGRA